MVKLNAGRLGPYFQYGPSNGGQIHLDGQRMVLFYASAFAEYRRGLIDLCGEKSARSLITRVGYAEGVKGGNLLRKLYSADLDDTANYRLSAAIHELAGYVSLEFTQLSIDTRRGVFDVELTMHNSIEAESHLSTHGSSLEPVCWLLMGYLSGYSSTFMGRMVVFRESRCAVSGHDSCHMVGRLASHWSDVDRKKSQAAGPLISRLSLESKAKSLVDTDEIVGVSSAFHSVICLVDKVASTRSTVLLHGETGVGKEVIARYLHKCSNRANQPFIAVNCAAIPVSLIESELFGVERGAFSGATHSRLGRFERADGGTLFLDEIGTLDFAAQGKLLRVLQEGELERLGDQRTRKVDVRVIAATNNNLRTEVREGRFREDLFFRLTTFPIRVPPLRERRSDIPLLVEFFFQRFCRLHKKNPSGFTPEAITILMDHAYPGNIRQLEHLIERAVILADENQAIESYHLNAFEDESTPLIPKNRADGFGNLDDILHDARKTGRGLENEVLHIAIKNANGNVSQAARALGLTRRQLGYKLKKQKIL